MTVDSDKLICIDVLIKSFAYFLLLTFQRDSEYITIFSIFTNPLAIDHCLVLLLLLFVKVDIAVSRRF